MRIVSKQQVMSLLKARKINIKDFDYIENETTDEDIAKTPSIVKYKRWWENQVLWGILFKNKMNDIIKYFIDEHIMSTDIIKASIVTKYDKKFTSRLIELYIDTNDFTDEEKSITKDDAQQGLTPQGPALESVKEQTENVASSQDEVDDLLASLGF